MRQQRSIRSPEGIGSSGRPPFWPNWQRPQAQTLRMSQFESGEGHNGVQAGVSQTMSLTPRSGVSTLAPAKLPLGWRG